MRTRILRIAALALPVLGLAAACQKDEHRGFSSRPGGSDFLAAPAAVTLLAVATVAVIGLFAVRARVIRAVAR